MVFIEDVLTHIHDEGTKIDRNAINGVAAAHAHALPGAFRVLLLVIIHAILAEVNQMLLSSRDKLRHCFILKLDDVRTAGLGFYSIIEFGVFRTSLTSVRPAHLDVIMVLVVLIDYFLNGWIPGPHGDLFRIRLFNLVLALCIGIRSFITVLSLTFTLGASTAATGSHGNRQDSRECRCNDFHSSPHYFSFEYMWKPTICNYQSKWIAVHETGGSMMLSLPFSKVKSLRVCKPIRSGSSSVLRASTSSS